MLQWKLYWSTGLFWQTATALSAHKSFVRTTPWVLYMCSHTCGMPLPPSCKSQLCVHTLLIFVLMFSMVCCYAWVLLLCTIGSTSSSPAQFMVVNRKVDTPSVTEPEYWSIKSNSPGPRISYLTNRHNQNHYVVNTSPAVSIKTRRTIPSPSGTPR